MAQIIGLLDGTNINHDYQLGMEREVLLPSLGVIVNGLAVTSGQVGT